MPLQSLWMLASLDAGWALNLLGLFFCATGGWLLIATRLRLQRCAARLSLLRSAHGLQARLPVNTALNRFFYCFGGVSLLAGLVLSALSRAL